MTIPQAYLQHPDQANAMARMLQARLGYAKLRPTRVSSGGGGRGGGGASPSDRTVRKAKEAALKTAQSQAEANVMATKAQTKEMKAAGAARRTAIEEQRGLLPDKNEMAKEKHESDMLDALADRTKTVMGNLGQWVPQVTQENYRDLYNFGQESLGNNVGSFMPDPDGVEGMSPVEWKVAHSKLQSTLESPSDKKTRGIAVRGIEIEKKQMAKDKSAARKEYIRIQGVLDKVDTTGGISPEIFAMMSPEAQARLQGADREEYTGILEEYAQQLMDEYGFKFNTKSKGRPDSDTLQKYLDEAKGDRVKAAKNMRKDKYEW